MKTLKNHTIIYDCECPMCQAYTSAFVQTGMLDKLGREAFQKQETSSYPFVDWTRAKNEIALIDRKHRVVTYGIASLFKVIGNSLTFLQPLFRLTPFKWIMTRIYFFISFNRKVIVPGKESGIKSCNPSMSVKYRLVYIVFAWVVTSLILNSYSHFLSSFITPSNFTREFIVCGGQILFQGLIVMVTSKTKLIHYLGNLMTISFGGALLLAPVLFFNKAVNHQPLFLIYFMLVVSLMLLEHVRRVKLLGLPKYLSITWVVYRILVLSIILGL